MNPTPRLKWKVSVAVAVAVALLSRRLTWWTWWLVRKMKSEKKTREEDYPRYVVICYAIHM
jgi:hypothetical protein